jgi:hypothetical protein
LFRVTPEPGSGLRSVTRPKNISVALKSTVSGMQAFIAGIPPATVKAGAVATTIAYATSVFTRPARSPDQTLLSFSSPQCRSICPRLRNSTLISTLAKLGSFRQTSFRRARIDAS